MDFPGFWWVKVESCQRLPQVVLFVSTRPLAELFYLQAQQALAALIEAADQIAGIKLSIGRTAPDVITLYEVGFVRELQRIVSVP